MSGVVKKQHERTSFKGRFIIQGKIPMSDCTSEGVMRSVVTIASRASSHYEQCLVVCLNM